MNKYCKFTETLAPLILTYVFHHLENDEETINN